jgi:septal ring factor EnvC (AmiA/AmiB activator)
MTMFVLFAVIALVFCFLIIASMRQEITFLRKEVKSNDIMLAAYRDVSEKHRKSLINLTHENENLDGTIIRMNDLLNEKDDQNRKLTEENEELTGIIIRMRDVLDNEGDEDD